MFYDVHFDLTDQCKPAGSRCWVSMATGLQHGEAWLQSEDNLPLYEAHRVSHATCRQGYAAQCMSAV